MTMPMIGEEQFDKSLIPGHHKKDVRRLIEVAVMLGWKMHVSRTNQVTLVSYDERKKYHLSKRSTISYNRMFRDVAKYADPEKCKDALFLRSLGLPDAMIPMLLPNEADATVREPEPEPEPEQPQKTPPRTLVSRAPMIAKEGGGRGYESETTNELRWSDGTMTYRCRYKGCTYESGERLGPSRHYAGAHRNAPVSDPKTFKAEVPEAATYSPRASRVAALAARLREAWESGEDPDFEALAREALTWVHEQSSNGTDLAAEAEEMTPEETLARIRALLDDGAQGRARKQVDELAERVVSLEAALAEQSALADEARKQAQKARDDLHAFVELAQGLETRDAG